MKGIKCFKGIILTATLFLLYFFICPYFFSMLLRTPLNSPNFWIRNIAYLSVYILTFIVVFLMLHKDLIKQWKDFIKEPKKYLNKGLSYWGYGIVVMLLSNLIIQSFVGNMAVNEQSTREMLFSSPLYVIPTIIFFGPFFEEIIFRYSLRKSFQKELYYALTSAFIFGGMHIITAFEDFTIQSILAHATEFLFIVPYGALGFFFAKAYYQTDNIYTTIIPHMFHNTLSVILILVTHFLSV